TPETTVAEALERVPNAVEVFEQHGVDPRSECGPRIHITPLADTPFVCHVDDLDALLADLQRELAAGAQARGGRP
ncbi:MAG: hypothetical protein ABEK03_02485, partial [Candidatus Bipolaricaulia bacterium]